MGRPAVTNSSSSSGTPHSSRSSSTSSHSFGQTPRPRSNTDPQTCLEVFRSHWLQAYALMCKVPSIGQPPVRRSLNEEIDAVLHYTDQMVLLMVEEEDDNGQQGPILQYLLEEDVLDKLLQWASAAAAASSEHSERLKLHQLRVFETMISQARQPLFVHKPLIRPLLRLLAACSERVSTTVEERLVLVLHQLCVSVTQNTHMLELLFSAGGSSEHGPARFLVFSLLIPYIHRQGGVGQQARDALLLIMALSCVHDHIGRYIAQNSDFCPVCMCEGLL